jgi:serine phosphatase RsbU (regulator of sigma subunit)
MERAAFLRICRLELRQVVISMVIGVAIGMVLAVSQSAHEFWQFAVGGAIVGFCIYAVISILSILFNRFIELLPERMGVVAEGIKYVVGGAGGYFVGLILANALLGGGLRIPTVHGPLRTIMLLTAGIALVVGFLFRTFETMASRLRQREWAERELEIARSIQKRLLPPTTVDGDGFTVAARNLPAHYVAGDFYDVVRLDDGSVMVIVADVAGKGVAASLIMSSVKAVLPFVARGSVGETMRTLNRKLTQELGPREFVALVCARFHPSTGVLEVANAGCPDPYIVTGSRVEAVVCDGDRLPLGVRADVTYTTTTRRLEPGSRLLMLSDGIPEAPTGDGQLLGYDAFQQMVDALRNAPDRGVAWLDRLLNDVRARVGETLEDDWTALLLERAAA